MQLRRQSYLNKPNAMMVRFFAVVYLTYSLTIYIINRLSMYIYIYITYICIICGLIAYIYITQSKKFMQKIESESPGNSLVPSVSQQIHVAVSQQWTGLDSPASDKVLQLAY